MPVDTYHEVYAAQQRAARRSIWRFSRHIARAALFLLVLIALLAAVKLISYELPGAVPRLRSLEGKQVRLPVRKYVSLGELREDESSTGILKSVSYRWIDYMVPTCDVTLVDEGPQHRYERTTSLSPHAARKVEVVP